MILDVAIEPSSGEDRDVVPRIDELLQRVAGAADDMERSERMPHCVGDALEELERSIRSASLRRNDIWGRRGPRGFGCASQPLGLTR